MIDAVQAKAPKPIRLSAQVFLGAILFVAACAELPYRQLGERTAELPAGKLHEHDENEREKCRSGHELIACLQRRFC